MKTDENGFLYYDKLPDGYRLATINDFHFQGKKKLGMAFLIKWETKENYYEVCKVSEKLTGNWLVPFIKAGRVFCNINSLKNEQ